MSKELVTSATPRPMLSSVTPRVGIVREVNCVGVSHSPLSQGLDQRFPENAEACRQEFESGRMEPGLPFVFDPSSKNATTVSSSGTNAAADTAPIFFNLPTRVHWKGVPKREWVLQCIEATLQAAIQHQVYQFEIYRFDEDNSSKDAWDAAEAMTEVMTWRDVKLAFLTSFARLPDARLRFMEQADPIPLKQVTVFTDGGADPNPGAGGYGVVLRFGDSKKELSQGYLATSNNRMELMAAVVALEALKQPCKVLLHSDSRYIVDSVNTGLVFRWRQNNWKAGKVKNVDLWERFVLAYFEHQVEMIWVKGHAGISDNERCDALATEARKRDVLLPDGGYVPSKKSKKKRKAKSKTPTTTKTANPSPNAAAAKKFGKPKQVGDPCRTCGRPLIRRETKKSNPNSAYYFTWYLYCEPCGKLYHVEEAKVYRK